MKKMKDREVNELQYKQSLNSKQVSDLNDQLKFKKGRDKRKVKDKKNYGKLAKMLDQLDEEKLRGI